MQTSEISDKDRVAVQALRELVKQNLSDYYDTDYNLLRWIQGFSDRGDLNFIATKLNAHLKGRLTTWKLDELGVKPRTHPIHAHWPEGVIGYSNVLDNVVVYLEQCGHTDYRGMLETYSVIEILRARIPDFEDMLRRVMELEKSTGRQASVVYLMDLSGLQYDKQLYQLVTGSMRRLSEFIAEHYVELIKYFVLVNVPTFVYALVTIVRPLLPERTRDKIRILSSSNWREEILDYVQADILPTSWNEPKKEVFKSTVLCPKPYPESGFYRIIGKCPENYDEMLIGAGKTRFLIKELKTGEKLSFWIRSNGDFDFGIFMCENADEEDINKMETIYPNFGCIPGPMLVPIEDVVMAQRDGEYKIYFSNARAWWSNVKIHCRFEVIT